MFNQPFKDLDSGLQLQENFCTPSESEKSLLPVRDSWDGTRIGLRLQQTSQQCQALSVM